MNCSLAGQQHLAKIPTLSYRTDHRVVVTRVLGFVGSALPDSFADLLKAAFVPLHINRWPYLPRLGNRLGQSRFLAFSEVRLGMTVSYLSA
jgi:hypothetical protein